MRAPICELLVDPADISDFLAIQLTYVGPGGCSGFDASRSSLNCTGSRARWTNPSKRSAAASGVQANRILPIFLPSLYSAIATSALRSLSRPRLPSRSPPTNASPASTAPLSRSDGSAACGMIEPERVTHIACNLLRIGFHRREFGLYLDVANRIEWNRTGSNTLEWRGCLAGYPAKEKRVTRA